MEGSSRSGCLRRSGWWRVIGSRRGRDVGRRPARDRAVGVWSARLWRATLGAAAITAVSMALPLVAADAHSGARQPSLNELVAQARLLARQIDMLSQQYDGLRVRLIETRRAARAAAKTATRLDAALDRGKARVSEIAAQSYKNGGYDPALELAISDDPQRFIDQLSIMDHLRSDNGAVIDSLRAAQAAANRARQTARQQAGHVTRLVKQMAAKRDEIQRKIDVIESAAYKQALAIANRTGHFPVTAPIGDSLGARALRFALTRQGAPYVWGAAGPTAFDCSGLVKWGYEQMGISLPHYTGDQWNSGVHVSRSQLQPGDIVFFYGDLSHDGLYVGGGLMIDAPNFGEPVRVEPVWWNYYVGAVRIAI